MQLENPSESGSVCKVYLWVQGIDLPSHALRDIIAQKAFKIVYSYEPLQHQA